MPQIIWNGAETGVCYHGNLSTYCNPSYVDIAVAGVIVFTFLLITIWIGIHYTGGLVREP